MAWLWLILAGICEVVWALALKFSMGFTKPFPSLVSIVFMALSFGLLALATIKIPISIAYTIWVGIGAAGAYLGGIFIFKEVVSTPQIICFILVMIGVIGLKITSLLAAS